MFDLDSVIEHLDALKEYAVLLEETRKMPYEEFSGDHKNYLYVEHVLQLAIQNVLDVASHIAVALGQKRPKDYGEAILALGEMGVIPLAYSGRIVGMANLRNLLIHEYLRIDLRKLYDGLQTGLDDFRRFSEYVTAWLEREGYLPRSGSEDA